MERLPGFPEAPGLATLLTLRTSLLQSVGFICPQPWAEPAEISGRTGRAEGQSAGISKQRLSARPGASPQRAVSCG